MTYHTSDLSSLDPKSSIFHILPLFLQLCFSPRELLLQSLQCLTVSQDIMLYYLYFSAHAVSFLCNIFSFFPHLEQFCSPLKTWLRYQPFKNSVLSRATRHSTSQLFCTEILYNIYHMVKWLVYIFDPLAFSSLCISWEQRPLNYSTFFPPQKGFIASLDSSTQVNEGRIRLSTNIYLTNKGNNFIIYQVITRHTDSLEKRDHRKSRR